MRSPGNKKFLLVVRGVYCTELGVNKTGPYLGVVNASGDEGKSFDNRESALSNGGFPGL